ncbi:MAG TPA: acyl-CoA dehydrogenase family protein [Burkholderiales bacterium]|nr:acyl-CoA dehydrogenase family protein [Burkholderiales bacterium]
MDFRLGRDRGDDLKAFRAELREVLARYSTPEARSRAISTGTWLDWDLHREMAKRGWIGDDFPKELGGRGNDPVRMIAMREELDLSGAPWLGWIYARMIASSLRAAGSEQQKKEFIPRLLGGEMIACLGYTEPGCGSDVAAAATKARKLEGGNEWVIDGQKMFTTVAEVASYVFLLTRTDPSVPKHKGLTLFLVPLNSKGIEVREVKTLGGERTNVTFYKGVRVPDSSRVGEVNGGWKVMLAALAEERPGGGRDLKDKLLLATLESVLAAEGKLPDDPVLRESLARCAVENEVSSLLGYRAMWLFGQGKNAGVEGSMFKLFSSESLIRSSSMLLDAVGPLGLLREGEQGALAHGEVEHLYRHSHVETIYGGSSEIQRGIIAEHRLGLPKSR